MPRIGDTISLHSSEQRLAEYMARACAKSNSHLEEKMRATSNIQIHDRNGFGAELAFGRLFNRYPDLSIRPRSGGSDFILDGYTIDVKCTARPEGQLITPPHKAKDPCDFYALMLCSWPRFTLEELVNQITPENVHGETDWGPPAGRESW